MKADKYGRTVTLLCPTCGNSELELEDKDTGTESIRCPSCGRVMSREELVRENGENIDANVEEVKAEILKDVKKEFRNVVKKAFKGSKASELSR